MPRPRKCRKVCCLPKYDEFRPTRSLEGNVESVVLTVDEYETIRLIDNEGFSQEECGEYMKIARATVQQAYTEARKKLAAALVNGRPLIIRGGYYRLCEENEPYCGRGGCHRHRNRMMPEKIKEEEKMMIAIPLDENKMSVCASFGRAPYFMIYNTESGNTEIVNNSAASAQGGAGIKAAQQKKKKKADTLITVRCGENAAEVFKAAGIKIYQAEGADAKQNIEAMKNGQLVPLTHFHAGFHGKQ